MAKQNIVIFDGFCNFCEGAVKFIIRYDPEGIFEFTPLQSAFAQELIAKYQRDKVDIDTLLLIKDDHCFSLSSAAIEITKDLSGFWSILHICRVIPKPIRDFFYRILAGNRYRLFGKKTVCMIPSENIKSRFIGV